MTAREKIMKYYTLITTLLLACVSHIEAAPMPTVEEVMAFMENREPALLPVGAETNEVSEPTDQTQFQLSYSESSMMNTTDMYYQNRDRRIQFEWNGENDKYYYLQYRRAQQCTGYCGFTYTMLGLGLGKRFDNSLGEFFIQAGYYKITNSLEDGVKFDENLWHYFSNKFGGHKHVPFEWYKVENDDAISVSLGQDFELGDNYGVKFQFEYLKVKEIIIGYFTYPPEALDLWWDPVVRDLSNISVGFYYEF